MGKIGIMAYLYVLVWRLWMSTEPDAGTTCGQHVVWYRCRRGSDIDWSSIASSQISNQQAHQEQYVQNACEGVTHRNPFALRDGMHLFCLSGNKSTYMYVIYVPGLSMVKLQCDILFEAPHVFMKTSARRVLDQWIKKSVQKEAMLSGETTIISCSGWDRVFLRSERGFHRWPFPSSSSYSPTIRPLPGL